MLFQVIKESGELALSWVKSHAYDLYITKLRSQDPLKVPDPIDIHLHLPSGAVKKDGPSAGIAMVSLFSRLAPQFESHASLVLRPARSCPS